MSTPDMSHDREPDRDRQEPLVDGLEVQADDSPQTLHDKVAAVYAAQVIALGRAMSHPPAPGMVEIRQDDLEHLLDWHNKRCGEAKDEGMFARLQAALPEGEPGGS